MACSPFIFFLAACGVIAVAETSLATAEVVVSDSFSLIDARTSGAHLNGSPPEVGSGVWLAMNEALFSSKGKIVNSTATEKLRSSFLAEIEFEAPGSSGVVSVEASLLVGTSEWVGIGFQSQKNISNWFDPANLLWVILRPSGKWQIFNIGVSEILAGGQIPEFNPNVEHVVKLSYDCGKHEVTLFVDGEQIREETPIELDPATIISAGFNGLAVKEPGLSSVDDFKVTFAESH